MKIVTITNVSKDFNYVFISQNPVTEQVVKGYLEKQDNTLKMKIYPAGIYSNTLNQFIEYNVNFVEEV